MIKLKFLLLEKMVRVVGTLRRLAARENGLFSSKLAPCPRKFVIAILSFQIQ